MDSMSLLALVGVVSAGGGVAVGMIIKGVTSTKHIELAKKMGALEADANDGEKIKEAMETYKASTELKAMHEVEYRKGFEAGQMETLNRFQIQYEKFSHVEDKWTCSVVETGYCMQLFYNGLPIGDVTRRVLHAEKRVNKEAVQEILQRLDKVVDNLITTAKDSNVPVKIVSGLRGR